MFEHMDAEATKLNCEKLTNALRITRLSGPIFLPFVLRSFQLIQMSQHSNMATLRPLPSSFPDQLKTALNVRGGACTCPASVETNLKIIPYFNKRTVVAPATNHRFGNLRVNENGGGGNWRNNGSSDDGFQTVHHGRRRHYEGGGGGGFHRTQAPRRNDSYDKLSPTSISTPVVESPTKDDVQKFSSAAIKATIDVEDRILAKVKGKINKMGPSTFDSTKAFMQQILDSDETEFLDEFMKFVFHKAATESVFCTLYARLLHELADEFTHLRKVMISLFKDYADIFSEVESTPDVGSENYRAFVEAQERKKFRRGYSQFVAELVKLGETDREAYGKLLDQIVSFLESRHTDASATLLCEEYIDCLANLCGCASAILCEALWADGIRNRLSALASKPRTMVPGFTNKARFALMDLVESAQRGWK